MARNPASVTPDTSVREAAQLMKSEDVGIIPVVRDNSSRELIGLITDRDNAVRVVAEGRDASSAVRDAMSSNPKSCGVNADVAEVMKVMSAEQVRRVPIVDERGALVGIVSQADVLLEGPNGGQAERTVEAISQPGGKHTSK
jgi:CBS domain-containing protein